jgi:hypothetical protein
MYAVEALEAKISGDFPINCSKYGKIQSFGSYKRKNSPYL